MVPHEYADLSYEHLKEKCGLDVEYESFQGMGHEMRKYFSILFNY